TLGWYQMATRKQRARRAKTFRHDYGFVDYDDEGNEVELTGAELRAKKDESSPSKPKQAAKSQSSSRRTPKEPQPPSWDRSIKRGLMWGAPMIVLMFLLFKDLTVYSRILLGVVYAVMFIPLTYWVDGMVYRKYQQRKQSGKAR